MDKIRSSRQKRISLRQEKQAAKDIGGRTVAGSGAAKHSGGGDVRKRGELRLECKFTEKMFFVLKHAELLKIRMEALKGGLETPVFQISFANVRTGQHEQYVVLSRMGLPPNANVLAITERKRIRFTKEELQRALLTFGKTHVIFARGKAVPDDVFEILPWHDFLKQWEEQEHEC